MSPQKYFHEMRFALAVCNDSLKKSSTEISCRADYFSRQIALSPLLLPGNTHDALQEKDDVQYDN